jgi:hypothetical protein
MLRFNAASDDTEKIDNKIKLRYYWIRKVKGIS